MDLRLRREAERWAVCAARAAEAAETWGACLAVRALCPAKDVPHALAVEAFLTGGAAMKDGANLGCYPVLSSADGAVQRVIPGARGGAGHRRGRAPAKAVGPDAVGPDAVGPDAVGPDAVGPDAVGPKPPATKAGGCSLEVAAGSDGVLWTSEELEEARAVEHDALLSLWAQARLVGVSNPVVSNPVVSNPKGSNPEGARGTGGCRPAVGRVPAVGRGPAFWPARSARAEARDIVEALHAGSAVDALGSVPVPGALALTAGLQRFWDLFVWSRIPCASGEGVIFRARTARPGAPGMDADWWARIEAERGARGLAAARAEHAGGVSEEVAARAGAVLWRGVRTLRALLHQPWRKEALCNREKAVVWRRAVDACTHA
jgi:hypothetical protein